MFYIYWVVLLVEINKLYYIDYGCYWWWNFLIKIYIMREYEESVLLMNESIDVFLYVVCV